VDVCPDKAPSVNIYEVAAHELDMVAAICLDPSVPKTRKKAMESSMEARKRWLSSMMQVGLKVAVALGPRRGKLGLIEYIPIQHASEPVQGKNSLFINCIWVIPPIWKKGVAKTLLSYAIEQGKKTGGITTLAYDGDKWFGVFPYMPSSFFQKFGFKEVDRDDSRVLLHMDLGGGNQPSLIRPKTQRIPNNGKVVVEILFNNQCPWSGWMVDKAQRALKKYDATVVAVNTDDQKILRKYGLARGVLINGVPAIKRMATVKEIESLAQKYALPKSQETKKQ